MAAPPGQFIVLQAINALKETISGQAKAKIMFDKELSALFSKVVKCF